MSETPKKPKKPDVRTLFRERMKREGRTKEWNETIRAVQAETGKQFGRIVYDVMKRMGYEGPEKERELAAAFESSQRPTDPAANNIDEIRKKLPDRAAIATEINWVLSNGAMYRRACNRNIEEIRVTVADVLGPPKCPSKAALTLLQHCANQPNEFYKQFMADMKRITKDDNAANVNEVEDLDLEDVRKVLEEVAA